MRAIIALAIIAATCLSVANADDAVPPVPFAIDSARSDPARPSRPLGKKYRGPIFDTHTHIFVALPDPNSVIDSLRKADVGRLVILPTPNAGRTLKIGTALSQMDLLRRESKGAILVMCGSDYLTTWMQLSVQDRNPPDRDDISGRMDRLARDLKSGACAGVGEIGFRHYDKTSRQLVIDLPAGYPALLAIAETAATLGVPLDLHAEPVEPNGARHEADVFATIGAMFRRAPNLKLVSSHTGMTNARNARRLLQAFPTMMMNINFAKHGQVAIDWSNLEGVTDDQRRLYADWAELFEDMSDRFMVGTDYFFGRSREDPDEYERRIGHVRRALGSLDPAAARRIAHENAERLFGGR